MRIAITAFTRTGYLLAKGLEEALVSRGEQASVQLPPRLAAELSAPAYETLGVWTAEAFARCDALVFVSASGIAVRSIAPHVHDKLADPAVLCIDEGAQFVVPLLSGHVGGANELARRISGICGAQAVITTATDVQGCFAVDVWAKEQGLVLGDRELAKQVSARLLEGAVVGFASDYAVVGPLPEGLVADGDQPACELGISVSLDSDKRPFAQTLVLVPQVVSVGVGCRRGTDEATIARAVDACLAKAHVDARAVRCLATIDAKADEAGLLAFAASRGWRLRCHSAKELAAVPGSFASSSFVYETVGVDNVCERAACAEGATLLLGRQASEGVTVALAATVPELSFGGSEGEEGLL